MHGIVSERALSQEAHLGVDLVFDIGGVNDGAYVLGFCQIAALGLMNVVSLAYLTAFDVRLSALSHDTPQEFTMFVRRGCDAIGARRRLEKDITALTHTEVGLLRTTERFGLSKYKDLVFSSLEVQFSGPGMRCFASRRTLPWLFIADSTEAGSIRDVYTCCNSAFSLLSAIQLSCCVYESRPGIGLAISVSVCEACAVACCVRQIESHPCSRLCSLSLNFGSILDVAGSKWWREHGGSAVIKV